MIAWNIILQCVHPVIDQTHESVSVWGLVINNYCWFGRIPATQPDLPWPHRSSSHEILVGDESLAKMSPCEFDPLVAQDVCLVHVLEFQLFQSTIMSCLQLCPEEWQLYKLYKQN